MSRLVRSEHRLGAAAGVDGVMVPMDLAPGARATSEVGATPWDGRLLVLVVLALVLNSFWLWWGLPPVSTRLWEIDGIAPLEPLATAKGIFVDEWWNSGYYRKYPLGHYFVLMGAYAPYLMYLKLTGGLATPSDVYPFGFAAPETVITALALIARGVSAVMGAGIVALIYLMVRPLAGRGAAVCSALTVAVSPAFIYYAHTSNIDTPSLFWCALGLFAFGRLVQGRTEVHNFLLLGFAVGMAAATKEQTVGMFLLVPASVVVLQARRGRPGRGRWGALAQAIVARPVVAALAASIATFVVATHLIFNWHGSVLRFRWRLFGIHPTWGTDYPFAWIEVDGPLDALQHAATHTLDVMNPLLFIAAGVGLVVLPLRHSWARHLAVPLVSYLGFAVVLFDFFRARFVMQLVLVLAVFAGPVLATLWRRALRAPALALAVVAAGAYSLAYGFEINYLLMRDARYAAEAWFAAAASGATVETYGNPVYLPRLPGRLTVRHHDFTEEELRGLLQRWPDYVVLTGAHFRYLRPGSPEQRLVERLFRGDFGYRLVRTFDTPPLLTPPMIQGLSPDVVVLAGRP